MKKTLLLLWAFVLSTMSFSQPCRQLAPMKADKSDIIMTQPNGELRYYMRSGGATDVVFGFVPDLPQEGKFLRVVFAPNGKNVYFQNLISRAPSGSWVRGIRQGDEILVPYGQMSYWFDDPVNPSTGEHEEPYGLKLAEVCMNGSFDNYTVTTTGNAVFRIEGNQIKLQGTSADLENDNIVGLGLVYTDKYENDWSHYMDYESVFTEVDFSPVTPPEGIVTERYSINHGIYGHFVDVAFLQKDVYVRGVSEENIPNAWLKGTFEADGKIHFPLQDAAAKGVYLYSFFGTDITKVNDYYGGTYEFELNPENTEIIFDYDESTRSFQNNDRALVVCNRRDTLENFERFPKPKFCPYTERAATPAAPEILQIDDRFWAWGYKLSTVAVNIPCYDEDGNFIDPTKLFYSLYVDDDEPYLLYKDEYEALPFDEVDEIPYLYTDNKYIYPKSNGLYIFQNGFDRMGIKSIYYGGNDRRESIITYKAPNSVGIKSVKGQEADGKYFDLSGRPVVNPTKGIYIVNGRKVIK